MTTDGAKEPRLVFERLAQRFGGFARPHKKKTEDSAEPFTPGRDPGSFADAFDDLSATYGWSSHLARAELLDQWEDVVGSEVAAHATPVSSDHGIVEVHCDSNAWATQLRLMRAKVLETLQQRFPLAEIAEVRVRAPGGPSWRHGGRTITGRGPRDTYA